MAPPIKGLSGLTVSSMKKYPAIVPLYALLGAGLALALAAVTRTAFKNPDVTYSHKNPEPWNAYKEKQYKVFAIGQDYTGVKSEAPDYK